MKNTETFHTVRGYQLIKDKERQLTFSMEDYLEMIYRDIADNGYTRINIIAALLNVQASSATKMVQKLAKLELVKYEKYEIILLTEEGKRLGAYLLKRHEIISNFLVIIGVNENILTETELIEHNISRKTLVKLEQLNLFFKSNPDIYSKYTSFSDNSEYESEKIDIIKP